MDAVDLERHLADLDAALASGVALDTIEACRRELAAAADRDEVAEALSRTGCPYCSATGSAIVQHRSMIVCMSCDRALVVG